MAGVMIAAPGSRSGKTMVTCGLLTLLRGRGYDPVVFRCGPDYINGLFHRRVLGVENGNLDSFFETGTHMRQKLSRSMKDCLVMAEGVVGYFGGLGGVSLRGNSFEIGNILGLPAVLVVDGRGANLSLVVLIQEFLEYDMTADAKNEKKSREKKTCEKEACNIRGIFFNRMSSMIYNRLKPMVEERFRVPVIGYLPELKSLQVGSHHLGLVLPDEIDGIRGQLKQLTDQMGNNLEWGLLLRIAVDTDGYDRGAPVRPEAGMASHFHLGIARDEAFCFYHGDNLGVMEQAGAELVYFSPLYQKELPKRLDGLILGGGYPKSHREALVASATMWDSVVVAADSRMPILTECGGYLYLLDCLEGADRADYPMVDVLGGHEYRAGKTGRSGYMTLRPNRNLPFLREGAEIKDHELHYWGCGCREDEFYMTAVKPNGGRYWSCMRTVERVMAGFPHLYYPSCPGLVQSFAGQCVIYGKEHEL